MYIVNAPLGDGSYDCRIVRFSDVLADPDRLGLTDMEKSQLPHPNDNVLHGILLPEDGVDILAE